MWLYYSIGAAIIIFVGLYYFDNLKYVMYSNRLKPSDETQIIQEADLEKLPIQIQKYLKVVGVVGHLVPKGMHLVISGEMKANKNMGFASSKVKQTSLFYPYERYFYMELKMKGLKVKGLHVFQRGIALMKIKLLGIIPVVNGKGLKMNQAETVTVFNDICLLAPHALLHANVTYQEIDENHLKATFTNEGISVSAVLTFDEEGKLINFTSNDRYFSQDGKENIAVPWSTPIHEYKEQNGLYLPYKGDAIWSFEDGDFTYFKLMLDDVNYIS